MPKSTLRRVLNSSTLRPDAGAARDSNEPTNARLSEGRWACLRPSIADGRIEAARSAAPASPSRSILEKPRQAVLAIRDRTAGTTGLRQPPTTRNPGGPAMITLAGNGRLTRDVAVRTTHAGKTVATISVASDRRDRDAQPA